MKKLVSMVLVLSLVLGLMVPLASAATLQTSSSVTVSTSSRGEYLSKSTGGTIGGGYWEYTSNDGIQGTAYCVDFGLSGPSSSKSLPLQPYNRSPHTMGAFANGYPQRSLEQFKELHAGDVRGIDDLTEDEYKYATQVAVWATCGQLSVPGTTFTAGRASVVVPTSDAQQIRIFDSTAAILRQASSWTQTLYTGMYLRAEENEDIRGVEIVHEEGLEGAAEANIDGLRKETIGGTEYYTRTLYVSSATSTWIDGYTTKVYSTDAPQGTIFVSENNALLETEQSGGVTYYRVDTSQYRETSLNANGIEFYGAFKLCLPVDSTAEEGALTVKAQGGVAQYNLYLAYNSNDAEQSFIVSDPGYTTCDASIPFSWTRTEGDKTTASLQIVKAGAGNAPLEGVSFTLEGSGGTTVTGTTDRDGIILWQDLPAGESYTLSEDPSTVPEGYLPIDPVGLTLTAGITNFKTITNTTERRFVLRKVDAQSKAALKDAVFVFEQIDGSYETSGTTGFDGVIEFVGDELPYGSYRVYEQGRLDGYCQDDQVETIHWTGEEDVELTWENTRTIGLRVVKYDSQSKISLSGAVFDVYADGAYLTSITTDDAGEARIDGIREGAYIELIEKTAPAGYELDGTPHGIHIDPYDPALEEDPVLRIPNDPLPSLRIIKVDRKNNYAPLEGVTFEVFRDGESLGHFVTDSEGRIELFDQEPGTFRVVEVDTGDPGIILSGGYQEIELKAGDSTRELVFFNDHTPGLKLVKVDSSDYSTVIANAVFEIRSVDGSYGPEEFRTDVNGEIDLSAENLPAGAYVVAEKSCPGYVVDDAQRIIYLDPNEDAEFAFTNSKLPSLTLTKTSSDGTPLEGVTYSLTRIEDGTRYDDKRTGPDGTITWEGLEPGVFSLVEQETLPDHILDPTEYHVELRPGEDGTIELTNHRRPDLIIHKSDADTGEPVRDTVFLVEAADGHSIAEVETGPDGTATVEDLLPGVYQVSEKSVPEPYLLDAEPQLVTLYPDQDRDVYFENHRKPTLIIEKENAITHDPLENVPFEVLYASSHTETGEYNRLGTYYTDAQGRIELSAPELSLRDGWFRVRELEAAPGFALADPDTQEAFIAAGDSHTFHFENTPLSALVVWKYDSVHPNQAIEGAVFQVRYLSGSTSGTGGTVIGTYRTSVNGSFTVTGLQAGSYVIEELSSDGSHVIDTPPQTVYLSGEEQEVVQVYFGNSPKGALLIKKVSSADHAPLSDVQFFVTESDGTVVGDGNGYFTTDSAGSILIEDIDPGTTLVVKETRAKDGFLLDDTPQTATIQAGQTVTLEFRNQPLGNLIIHKLDSVTKEPLEGVQFKITYADGSYLPDENGQLSSNGLYWSDSEGQIALSGVTGTLVVSEVQSIQGYTIDPDTQTQTVVVEPNDTQELYFYNTPLVTLTILKRSSADHQPLAGAEFLVKDGAGAPIGPNNGRYTSNSDGLVTISGLEPGQTVVAREVSAPEGFQLDSTPQSIIIQEDSPNQLIFEDAPLGNLIIHKLDSVTKEPLEGVQFKITYADGSFVDDEGGQLSSNGLYWSDSEGQVLLSGVTGTLVISEVQSIQGYTIDPDTQTQTVVVRPDDTQELYFYNDPIGGVEIIKVNEADRTERIPDVTFKIRRVSNDELIDTVTTGRDGRVYVPLEADSYYLVETDCPQDFRLDPTPIYFTVENGETTRQTVTNTPFSGVLIHKIDSTTGKGIPNVTFLVYDSTQTPIDQITTDQSGYAYLDSLTFSGRLYLRELEAEGYLVDQDLKTVYVKPGETTLVEWENTPILGQIQVIKTSANDNPINGLPAGTPLEGAVFEIYDKAGNVVDTIRSDNRGRAVSKLLPLGRYTLREVTAPDFYAVNPTVMNAYLEHEGQIITFEVEDDSVATGVNIKKTGPAQVISGQPIQYVISGLSNTSTVPLSSFYWRDALPSQVTLTRLVTGTYNQQLSYKIVYKTNLSGDTYRTLADNLSTTQNYVLDASPTALGLASNEKVTEFMVVFGAVKAGFAQVETPCIHGTVAQGLSNDSSFVNVADVGGLYNGQWIMGVSRWVTSVYAKPEPLPRTGY